jgi:hypothetical protein
MIYDVTSIIVEKTSLIRSDRDGLELGLSIQGMDVATAETQRSKTLSYSFSRAHRGKSGFWECTFFCFGIDGRIR